MDFITDDPFSEYSQRFYIQSYKKLYLFDRNPRSFREHITKIAYMFGDMKPLDIYDVLRMYGLLYCPQTEYQVQSFYEGTHPWNPMFYERWELFKKHNYSPDELPSVADFIETSDKPLPKNRLVFQGNSEKLMKNIFDAEYIWDEKKLERLRKTHGYDNIELVRPFKENPKRRYEWNKK